jgi:nucleoid DNA-binding protein
LLQDVVAAELRQQLAAAQGSAAVAEERVAAAEGRQAQLEEALHGTHATLQQRNAELAAAKKVRLVNISTFQLASRPGRACLKH